MTPDVSVALGFAVRAARLATESRGHGAVIAVDINMEELESLAPYCVPEEHLIQVIRSRHLAAPLPPSIFELVHNAHCIIGGMADGWADDSAAPNGVSISLAPNVTQYAFCANGDPAAIDLINRATLEHDVSYVRFVLPAGGKTIESLTDATVGSSEHVVGQ
eukprot:m.261913 g.261913  ORF g.261913 m.261913 type:complete len:162 (-) comp24977_c0_seq1:172-657(-)